ncbi:hypothetical protein PC116_g21218 [Phytophthora cactorum]|nr:hypothetical protein PC116_g21218 [Phytophthora cactorum]
MARSEVLGPQSRGCDSAACTVLLLAQRDTSSHLELGVDPRSDGKLAEGQPMPLPREPDQKVTALLIGIGNAVTQSEGILCVRADGVAV